MKSQRRKSLEVNRPEPARSILGNTAISKESNVVRFEISIFDRRKAIIIVFECRTGKQATMNSMKKEINSHSAYQLVLDFNTKLLQTLEIFD